MGVCVCGRVCVCVCGWVCVGVWVCVCVCSNIEYIVIMLEYQYLSVPIFSLPLSHCTLSPSSSSPGLHSRGEKVKYLGHWKRSADGNVEPMEQDNSPGTVWLRSNGVTFLEDGVTLEYSGSGGDVQDVGIAQSRFPLDRTNHYFEFEILGTGTHGALAIGLAKTTYPLHRHPGWNQGAVGYHADDGKLFKEKGLGEEFGPQCTNRDRMGCGIQFPVHADEDEREAEGSDDASSESERDSRVSLNPERLLNYDSRSSSSTSTETSESLESYNDSSDDVLPEDIFGQPRLFRAMGHQMRAGLVRANRLPMLQRKQPNRGKSGRTCKVYFTKNGEKVGDTLCDVPRGGFYPVVAMLSKGEKLRVDFNPLSG